MKIALIAHDKKKSEITELAIKYKDVLSKHELFATGTTGTLIMGETGLSICRMKSGPLGGDQQIGAMLANGELDYHDPFFGTRLALGRALELLLSSTTELVVASVI